MNNLVKFWLIGTFYWILLSFFSDITGYRKWGPDEVPMTFIEILNERLILYIIGGIIVGLIFSVCRKLFYMVNSYMVYKIVRSEPFSKDEIEILEIKKKYESMKK